MSDQKDAFPEGGDLSDMAATGTSVPEHSAKPRTIPSVAKPGQATDAGSVPNDVGATDLAAAADNASDMPRVSRFGAFPVAIHNGLCKTLCKHKDI